MLNSRMQKMIFYFFNLNKNKGRRMSLKKLMNAGFKSILNLVFNQKAERKKMDHQKSKSTFSAILLTLTLMVAAFWVSPAAVAAEKKMVTDPSTGKMVTAPEYGGTITYALLADPASPDSFLSDHAALRSSAPFWRSWPWGIGQRPGINGTSSITPLQPTREGLWPRAGHSPTR